MSRPEDEELALRDARERAEADDLAGRKARLAVDSVDSAHPLDELAVEVARRPFVSEMEMAVENPPHSERVERAEGFLNEAPKPEMPHAKVIVVPHVDRSRFQTDLSQRKQREIGLSESRTAGGRTARFLVAPSGPQLSDEDSVHGGSGLGLGSTHSANTGDALDSAQTETTSSLTATPSADVIQETRSRIARRAFAVAALFIAATIVPLVYFIAIGSGKKPDGSSVSSVESSARAQSSPTISSSTSEVRSIASTLSAPGASNTVAASAGAHDGPLTPIPSTHPRDVSTADVYPEPLPTASVIPSSHPPPVKPTAAPTSNPNIF